MNERVCSRAAGLLLAAGLATTGWAASLDLTTNLATNPPIPLASGGQNVRTNGSGVYDFGDKDGNGNRVDAVNPAGLDLGALKLYTDNGAGISLNLNGGAITGSTSVTALDTHRDSFAPGGPVQITNVADITMGKISTYIANGVYDRGETYGGGTISIGTALAPAKIG